MEGGRLRKSAIRVMVSLFAGAATIHATPAAAASNNVRISQISDVAFGLITNVASDISNSQSICVYSNSANDGYNVRAIGSGSGGAFTLASGSASLSYDLQWNSASGQTNGTALTPNVALSGQFSQAKQQTCNSGPSSSASLIVIIRSSVLASAEAGSYSGAVTLVIGPE
jgi:spore coat protein U-like protein